MAKATKTNFRCVIVDPATGGQLCTGIMIDVPKGLTREQAVNYVTGRISGEVWRYAAYEALGVAYFEPGMTADEIIT